MVGFGLAPRINAAGRLERAMRAVEMLTTEDPETPGQSPRNSISSTAAARRSSAIVSERGNVLAEGGLKERRAIVLGRKGWHPGVIGIVASRLVDYYQRPTVIVAFGDEFGQGSARSLPASTFMRRSAIAPRA